jgi:hypothetical protein
MLTKINNNHYTFNGFTILSSYDSQDKTFTFNVVQEDYIPEKVVVKSFIEFKNKVAGICAGMIKQIEIKSVDIDSDLTEDELALAEFIRSYKPEQEDVVPIWEIGETEDEILIALNKYLETEEEEDYNDFRAALAEELAIN